MSIDSHLLKFVSLCNDLRNNLLSNHADDTVLGLPYKLYHSVIKLILRFWYDTANLWSKCFRGSLDSASNFGICLSGLESIFSEAHQ